MVTTVWSNMTEHEHIGRIPVLSMAWKSHPVEHYKSIGAREHQRIGIRFSLGWRIGSLLALGWRAKADLIWMKAVLFRCVHVDVTFFSSLSRYPSNAN